MASNKGKYFCQRLWFPDENWESVILDFFVCGGVIQKLRGHNFALFWQPTYIYVSILHPERGQKKGIFRPPTHLILSK